MKVIVFVKQVPDTASDIKIQKDGRSIVEDEIKWVMNPYDEFAVEEALSLKEEWGGEVTVVSLGPERVSNVIRTALAMGADNGMLITDKEIEGLDSAAKAAVLAKTIKGLEYDIIFTGQRGVDEDQGVVGALIAEYLGIPQVSLATRVEVSENQKSAIIHRTAEGRTEVIKVGLPLLITAEKGLNEPRYATMRRIMMARKKPIDKKSLADLGFEDTELQEPKLIIVELKPPKERSSGIIIDEETPEENAEKLVRLLREEAKVL